MATNITNPVDFQEIMSLTCWKRLIDKLIVDNGGHANFRIATLANMSPEIVGAPTSKVAPVLSGTAQDTSVLTTTPGTYWGYAATLTYQWYRDGVARSAQTAVTYTCVTADVGHVMTCVETAANRLGSTTSTVTSGTVIA